MSNHAQVKFRSLNDIHIITKHHVHGTIVHTLRKLAFIANKLVTLQNIYLTNTTLNMCDNN